MVSSVVAVARRFLLLGCTSFGGPAAHLAFFRRTLAGAGGWLDDVAYARLVGLGQFLPGPTSSQVGALIGWTRAGWGGALAAFVGFTLPSALLLALAGMAVTAMSPDAIAPWLAGMKIAVVAVVADAVWRLGRSLCPGPRQVAVAALVLALVLALPWWWVGPVALLVAGIAGLGWLSADEKSTVPMERVPGPVASVVLVAVGLGAIAVGLLLSGQGGVAGLLGVCMQAGGLVFGGGHVVLPLLQEPLVASGLLDQSTFMVGYGLAQGVPGPLFTVAAFIGAAAAPAMGWSPLLLALLATLAIFLPGLTLALGCLRWYGKLLGVPPLARAAAGVNAGVVGLLAAALITPVGITALHQPRDGLLALAALLGLLRWGVPAPVVVATCAMVTTVWG